MRIPKILTGFLPAVAVALCCTAPASGQQNMMIEPMISGLESPWAVAPLTDQSALVTLKGGDLMFVKAGEVTRVSGVPEVVDEGQGGLLDVTLAIDFDTTREVFLTYVKDQGGGSIGTALARARLSADASALEDVAELFAMQTGTRGGRHFGSRVVQAADGMLFVTIGERGDQLAAQDLSRHNGKVIRLNRDGSVPQDNPFVGQSGARPEIWSYGHRNPQGAGFDLEGNLWVSEHGAKGGDEVNRIEKSRNYGWPVISFGVHYSGAQIGEGSAKEGMEQPGFYWDPSIAPSGLMVYSGKMFPTWQGDIFVGSLKFDYIAQLRGEPLVEVAQIKTDETLRVRDIVEAPDGAIWFISEINGAVYRIFR
ncbi:Glucose/arabinose dehydrogenase, beta-propeller fold [Sulfitobacter brevis]|uniref:Glucose/arabinose dehydrogenase, beta-propeller fold n=1 Tax=Sulfitobacter brevis TaxID=74348 RepID=A0A1I2FZK6_9RHOB|nr:PQQ-dependent sugar dehydrogenase [Sulfitobacter brevis]SFF09946.1 Glucose/arabinose dehydrogenase, beta-propeller fold [Sulfitobacter brevis]